MHPDIDADLSPRRQMDAVLTHDLADLKHQMSSMTDVASDVREVKRALWGPEAERQRETEPGVVRIVYDLAEAQKRRVVLGAAARLGLGTIGAANAALLIWALFRILTGQPMI